MSATRLTGSASSAGTSDQQPRPGWNGAAFPRGHRLLPAYFEPDSVPMEVARYGVEPHTLPVGSPGKVGILELEFEVRGRGDQARTELVQHYQKSPLQITKPLYYDPLRPDMPYTYIMTTGGGILHNDRQRTDLRFGEGTSAHVTTQADTKVYRMESGYATAVVNIDAAAGSYVEYVPDPVIPYIDSRYYQQTRVTVHPDASVVLGELIYAGRLGHGERYKFAAYASDVEARRGGPGRQVVALDRVRLVPRGGSIGGTAVTAGRDIVGTLFTLSRQRPAQAIAHLLHTVVSENVGSGVDSSFLFGVSTLPGAAREESSGAWLRFVSDDTVNAAQVYQVAAAAVRELLTGKPAPDVRK